MPENEPRAWFICTFCQGKSEIGQRHECVGLTPTQVAQKERIQAANARRAAEQATPEPCVHCGQPMTVGPGHICMSDTDEALDKGRRQMHRQEMSALRHDVPVPLP